MTSLLGGGVDRHVRDIARDARRSHLVWHAGDRAEVMEVSGEERYFPLDGEAFEHRSAALGEWLRRRRVSIVHAHSVSRAVRARATWAAETLGAPTIVTLHDILFLRREGFEPDAAVGPDPAWLAETAPFLERAVAVVAPSHYVADLARKHVPGLQVTIVPNGTPAPAKAVPRIEPRADFVARRPRHVVAVLGAIGPHKGSELLSEISPLLEGTDIAIVVIGYLDRQVVHGWHAPHVFVHGAYAAEDVGALLRAYGADLVLFPNPIPESFSYSLSEAWDAGIAAVVPPEGALAERVSRHGGGWLLPTGFVGRTVVTVLRRLLAPENSAELARVKSQLAAPDPERVPRVDSMTQSLTALYARFGIDPSEPLDAASPPAQELIAKNLDSTLFRQELVRLAAELEKLRVVPEEERQRSAKAAEEARRWMAKLEADIAALQAQLAAEVETRRELGQENVQLRIHKDAFDLLPMVLRKVLLKKILNARS